MELIADHIGMVYSGMGPDFRLVCFWNVLMFIIIGQSDWHVNMYWVIYNMYWLKLLL